MIELEQMQRSIAKNSFASENGMELVELTEETALGRMRLEERHMNIYHGMHGGCSYALADTVAGILIAARTGHCVTTVDGHMNYLLPVADTEYVYCRAKIVRAGNRLAVIEAEISNDTGEILCTASFTYYCTKAEFTLGRESEEASDKKIEKIEKI